MNHDIDKDYLLDTLRACVEVESPVGYYPEIHEWLREELAEMGYEMQVDNNATAYVRVPGRSAEKTVCLGAHLDTIGLVVRGFNADGTLRVRQLGGINYHSIEGETCLVHCRDGRTVAGQVICDHHSTHVFEDARTRERASGLLSALPVRLTLKKSMRGIVSAASLDAVIRTLFGHTTPACCACAASRLKISVS